MPPLSKIQKNEVSYGFPNWCDKEKVKEELSKQKKGIHSKLNQDGIEKSNQSKLQQNKNETFKVSIQR